MLRESRQSALAVEQLRTRVRTTATRFVLYVILMTTAAWAAFPLIWMAVSSLKTPAELVRLPPVWWPSHPSLDAYRSVFEILPYGRSLINSVLIAGGDTLGILITSVMAGYVFAKYEFRGRDQLFLGVLATMFVPVIVTVVPLFHVVQGLGLADSYAGVMLPQLANAFGIFLMRQFIRGVPDELIDAARVDGASEWTILWRVVVPLLGPAIATLGLFAFVYHWNNFLWPLTVLQSPEKFTVVVAMSQLLNYTSSIEYQNVVMAGALVSILPNILLFVLLQRFFVSTVAQAGIKG